MSRMSGKRLTRKQHEHLQALKMDSTDWLMCKCQTDEWTLVHRYTAQRKIVRSPEWN